MSTCKSCGAEFEPKVGNQIYCSDPCFKAGERHKYIEKHGALVPRACDQCGNEYQPKRRDSRFCSKLCNAHYLAENPTDYVGDPEKWAVSTPYFPVGGHAFDGWVSKCLTGGAHA